PEFEGYGPKTSKSVSEDISNEVKEYLDALLVNDRVSDNKDCSVESPVVVEKKTVVSTVAKIEFVRAKQQEKPVRKPVKYAKMYRPRPVNTARPRSVNTARPRPVNTARPNSIVVNAVSVNQVNVVNDSACWVWRPTKPNGASITLKIHNYIDVKTVNGEKQIQVLVDKKKVIITETSVRSDLHLEVAEGTECLPTATIFEQLTLMGAKTTTWNEFRSTIAFAIICLATNQKFNFSKYIFDHMVKNLEDGVKFLMFLRFVQVLLDSQIEGMIKHKEIYVTPSHTKKIFSNMKRQGKEFSDEHVTATFNDLLLSGEDRLKLNELIELCTQLQSKFIALETIRSNQALKIGSLKRRGMMIEDLDADEEVGLVDETQGRNDQDMFDTSILVDEEVVAEKEVSTADSVPNAGEVVTTAGEVVATAGEIVTTVGVEVSTAAITSQISMDEITLAKALIDIKTSKPKAKGIDNTQAWDNIQEEERGELTIEEKSRLFVELMNKRKKYFARHRAEKIRMRKQQKARAAGKLEQEEAKRQRMEEENKSA
nr:hypothetical protein [Tanacetum cinerariifolium]